MNIKELLPAFAGFAVGAASPQAGMALGQTLETLDAFKQRKRRQSIEDETLERAREQHEMSVEDQAYQRTQRGRADVAWERSEAERTAAMTTGQQMLKSLTDKGYMLDEASIGMLKYPESMDQLFQVMNGLYTRQQNEKRLIDDAPITQEMADKLLADLPEGNAMGVNIRLPEGNVVRRTLYKPQKSTAQTTTGMRSVMTAFGNLQAAIQEAQLADTVYTDTFNRNIEEEYEESAGKNAPNPATTFAPVAGTSVVPPSGKIKPDTELIPTKVTPKPSETASRGKAALNVQQAFDQLGMVATLYPDQYEVVLKWLADSTMPPELLNMMPGMEQAKVPGQPGTPAEQEESPGVAYARQFQTSTGG